MPSLMLHKTACAGEMTAMESLFTCGNATEPSGEEVANERAVLRMVQREMAEADEANLLEEEDMHVFGQEPLSDPLTVVSCNYCKKPIKASHYMAHAERCRSFSISDETLELDSGAGPRRPPRKTRKKIMSTLENQRGIGDVDRSLSVRNASPADLGAEPGIVGDRQVIGAADPNMVRKPTAILAGTTAVRSQKATAMSGAGTFHVDRDETPSHQATFEAGPSRASTAVFAEASSPLKRTKNMSHPFLTSRELSFICGVLSSDSTTCCRQPLTCGVHSESMKRSVVGRPQSYNVLIRECKEREHAERIKQRRCEQDETVIHPPIATKIYRFRHQQQMRSVISYLFHEAIERETSGADTNPHSPMGQQVLQVGAVNHTIDDAAHDLQCRLQPTMIEIMKQKDKPFPVPTSSGKTLQPFTQPMDTGIIAAKRPTYILPNLQDSQVPSGSTKTDVGHSAVLRSRVMQASQLLTISSPGSSLNSIQQPSFGSVHAT